MQGFGQTTMVSSQDISFTASDGLQPGMNAEIAVAWPRLLDDRIRLELVLQAIIMGARDGQAEAHILSFEFRTAGSAQTAQCAGA